jgi:hypothetical protein
VPVHFPDKTKTPHYYEQKEHWNDLRTIGHELTHGNRAIHPYAEVGWTGLVCPLLFVRFHCQRLARFGYPSFFIVQSQMDLKKVEEFVAKHWDESALPQLIEFVKVPNQSPGTYWSDVDNFFTVSLVLADALDNASSQIKWSVDRRVLLETRIARSCHICYFFHQ